MPGDPNQTMEAGVSQGPAEAPRPPCKHDSIRLDCWVDTHCLRCGAPGYWVDGELIAENSVDAIAKGHVTRGHPGGKTLISQGTVLDEEEEPASDAV